MRPMSCSWNTWDLWLAISSYLERFPRRRVATPWFLPCFLPLSTAKPVFDSVSPRIVTIKSYLTCWLFRIFFIFRWSDFFEFLFTPKEKYSWEFSRILIGKSCSQMSRLFKVTQCKWKVHPRDKLSLRLVSFKTRGTRDGWVPSAGI